MNIALMAHDRKKELMTQFCIAYCGILAEHRLCATHVTGKLVADATGLPITLYMHASEGGAQQIAASLGKFGCEVKIISILTAIAKIYSPALKHILWIRHTNADH